MASVQPALACKLRDSASVWCVTTVTDIHLAPTYPVVRGYMMLVRCMRWAVRAVRPRGTGLLAAVVVWWLVVAGAVVLSLPGPAASASPTPGALAPGQRARIRQPGIPHWPIPVTRYAFDTFQRGALESDETAIDEAFEVSEWFAVEHGQAVRVVTVDGEAVQIEILEGPYSGRQGWVKPRNLAPGE